MATEKQVKDFIEKIAPIIQKVAKEKGYKFPSAIIAQACCESAYGTSSLGYKYHNYFGMKCGGSWKGKSVNMATKEEFTVGTLTSIRDNFRAYNSMEAGVKGYFDFINYSRYANLKTATSPRHYLELIKSDGYATSSTYVNTNMKIVDKYNLTVWDNEKATVNTPDIEYLSNKSYNGFSIVTALSQIGVKADFSYRKQLAKENNIPNYKGSANQNLKLLELLKQGKLKKV